ncbi:MAG: hypothetical protein H6Q00_1648 [Holophagaceae bacterium]|nr:hypothetical protein [Holophagaceae bacterium]
MYAPPRECRPKGTRIGASVLGKQRPIVLKARGMKPIP